MSRVYLDRQKVYEQSVTFVQNSKAFVHLIQKFTSGQVPFPSQDNCKKLGLGSRNECTLI